LKLPVLIMLEAHHLTYKAGNTVLLEDVSVQFEPGKFHLIIGPNGAGKSTLIKILCGNLVPQAGTVLYHQKDLRHYSVAEQATLRAVLSQNIELAFPLTTEEVVMMG